MKRKCGEQHVFFPTCVCINKKLLERQARKTVSDSCLQLLSGFLFFQRSFPFSCANCTVGFQSIALMDGTWWQTPANLYNWWWRNIWKMQRHLGESSVITHHQGRIERCESTPRRQNDCVLCLRFVVVPYFYKVAPDCSTQRWWYTVKKRR